MLWGSRTDEWEGFLCSVYEMEDSQLHLRSKRSFN